MKPVFAACVAILSAAFYANAAEPMATNAHTVAIGHHVLELFESGDVNAFANVMAFTNAGNRKQVIASARNLLAQAARLKVDREHLRFHVKETHVPIQEQHDNPQQGLKKSDHPVSFGSRILLEGEPVAKADERLRGEYEVGLGGAEEFPDGWRTYEGIRWIRFPAGVADENTSRELAIIDVVEHNRLALTDATDPLLKELGQAIVSFLHDGSPTAFAGKVFPTKDESWAELQQHLEGYTGNDRPTRKQFEEAWQQMYDNVTNSLAAVSTQPKTLGIDFSKVQLALKSVEVTYPFMRGGYGSVAGLTASKAEVVVTVSSDAKSLFGNPISGDYVIDAERVQRTATKWQIQDKVRLAKYPSGLLSQADLATLEFENYIAEHRAFPPKTPVPDIECIRIDNQERVKLSNYRGKIVVLDWWATTCGPCQGPMADLQTLLAKHPDWKDKVETITISIDDTLAQARQHLAKRHWTNTFNLWAGEGDWSSKPAKQFRVTGIPTSYVISRDGKVLFGGHPGNMVEIAVIQSLKSELQQRRSE